MDVLKKHGSLLFSAILFSVLLVIAYPIYQYYIDPDATACLSIAKRYVAGDYDRAINGYWSPWGIWLTALVMRVGVAPFKAAIVVNAVGAMGLLVASHALFVLFRLRNDLRWFLNGALSVFLLYAVFWQSFDDLWECFFLLCALHVLLKEDFQERPFLWIVTGLLGTLAYFSKAYAFPFFVLEVVVCSYFMTHKGRAGNKRLWLKMAVVCIVSLLVFSFPWIYLLHKKYGLWTTGTAGPLNTSWYLVGHPFWKEGIHGLLPPVYADSLSYWEDAYYVNGYAPHFWSSPGLFLMQLVRLGFNMLKFVQSINELSCFFAFSPVVSLAVIFSRHVRQHTDVKFALLCVSFLLFPLGYMLVNFQGRYLWYMLPLSMVILATILQRSSFFYHVNIYLRIAVIAVLAFSFMAYPVWGLKEMYRKGENEHRMAQALVDLQIKGSFTTNVPYGSKTQDIVRLSYFSDNPYYNMPVAVPMKTLLQEMKRYHVRYYFHFYEGERDEFSLRDINGSVFPEVTGGKVAGLSVFLVNP